MKIKKFNENLAITPEITKKHIKSQIMSVVNLILFDLEASVANNNIEINEKQFSKIFHNIKKLSKDNGIKREEVKLMVSQFQQELLPFLQKLAEKN